MATSQGKEIVREPARGVPFILRVVWFLVLGWEISGVWILIAWALNATIIGLPLGLWMIDRVPQVLTLKPRRGMWEMDVTSGRSRYVGSDQLPLIIRAFYFLLIGWWFSLIWAAFGWLFCASIIGLPLGILMLHALPAVTTLHRN